MALERYPKRPLVRDGLEDLEAEKKRRRIPLEQVVQELSHAGLAQPALSFVQEVDKRRRVALPALPERPKRDAQDLVSCDAMKRRRIWTGGGQVPVLKVPEKQESSMQTGRLLPVRSDLSQVTQGSGSSLGPSTVQLLLSGATGLRQVTIDSKGIMFEVYDQGFMLTELPRGWQPIVNSSGRLARVAKVALDSKGTAYFLSETGELLMMVSAVKYLERPSSAAQEEIKLEFVDKKSIPSYARGDMEEHFSPSTVDPSPSMEDATDDEVMDWEDAPELLG